MKKSYSRRDFLKGAGLGGIGLFLAPNLFARNCLAPNSKINMAIIGCGKMAHGHISGLMHSDKCVITALCDVDSARYDYQKQRIGSEYKKRGVAAPDIKTYKDFRILLADPSIDAVYIVTPDHWHAIIAICAADAGKAVYCEKPLTFTIEEVRKVVEAAKRTGVVFQTGSQQRSSRSFKTAAQLVRNGYAGEIKEVWVGVSPGNATPRNFKEEQCPSTIDWEMWCGPSALNPYSSQLCAPFDASKPYDHGWMGWRHHLDYGNGSQADWGAHQFDIAMWGLGLDGKGPKYIEVVDKEGGIPGASFWRQYKYVTESGIPLYKGDHPKIPSFCRGGLTFVGTEAIISASRDGFWSDKGYLEQAKLREGDVSLIDCESHRDNFMDAVLKGTELIAPAEVGHSSCTICLLGNIAHNLGRSLEWDWRKEKFVNDSEADKFIGRPNRGQWSIY
jgi:hypothetical protein